VKPDDLAPHLGALLRAGRREAVVRAAMGEAVRVLPPLEVQDLARDPDGCVRFALWVGKDPKRTKQEKIAAQLVLACVNRMEDAIPLLVAALGSASALGSKAKGVTKERPVTPKNKALDVLIIKGIRSEGIEARARVIAGHVASKLDWDAKRRRYKLPYGEGRSREIAYVTKEQLEARVAKVKASLPH
jgi:hypothetical protein